MAKKSSPSPDALRKAVIAAAMTAAETKGWRDLTLVEIAEAAKLPLSALYPTLSSKRKILNALAEETDRAMLAEALPDPDEEGARDRLFDLVMRRFDALTPHREGLARVLRDLGRDPVAAVGSAAVLGRSLTLTLEAAGIATGGAYGTIKVKALGLVYLAALRTWINDDTADLSRTMASLDKGLRRLESLSGRLSDLGRRRGRDDEAEAAAA